MGKMKVLIFAFLAIGSLVAAEHRTKRQEYRFPGPREQRSYGEEPVSRQDTYRSPASRSYSQQDEGAFQVPRRQFQAQPVQQYAPAQRPAPRPPPPPPQQYNPPAAPPPRPAERAYSPPQEAPQPPRRKPAAPQYRSSSERKPSSRPPSQQLSEEYPEEEEEQRPDALTLLLQDSKFSCSSKTDGYYADNSIGCQVFHYCVGGARHSWMCPEGTRFHQVHLNCVPASQDICGQSEKFHFVNDYLHKPYEGPNNTVLYHQKYYPDGYSIGDPLVAPEQRKQEPRYQTQQNYAPQQTQPRPAPRPVEPPPQQYKPEPPPPPPTYRPAPPPRAPAPVYNPAPPQRPQPPVYNPPSQPAAPPRNVPRGRPSRPFYEEPPSFRSHPSGGGDYADTPRYQPQAPPSRPPPPPPPRNQQSSRYVPSQQQYGRFGNSARVQYDDEY